MNEEEMRKNPRLGGYVVQNLNRELRPLLGEGSSTGSVSTFPSTI
jgi:hypothetical protein